MAAVNTALLARQAARAIAKRGDSWPANNVGVMVVFCIVFVGTRRLLHILLLPWVSGRRFSSGDPNDARPLVPFDPWPSFLAAVFLIGFPLLTRFKVAVGVIGLYIAKCLKRRKERNQPKY
ncbi:hypothetical protein UVI_02041700 [Ustilaginoidea virens]|uniref:Uncharacterized protein n=1 Tax=Ustilaginoidea virens TaxID=1159556 RepID=A0A1B5LA29_USTVR|nr:hypothetical protein UVI_02041700 [Ustilaginoidea virens]